MLYISFGYAFSSAMYKLNNTGVAQLAARPLNNTGVEKLAAFLHSSACVFACERAASCATPAELKA